MAIQLEIKAQPGLTWAKQVEVCLDGIQHRMLRSLITLMVIALAVAFLTNVCVEWAVTTKLRRGVGGERERESRLDRFVAAVSRPVTPRELERLIGALPAGVNSAEEAAISGWIDAKDRSIWPPLEVFAQRSRELDDWYEHQSVGYKRVLGGAGGAGGLRAAFADAAGRERITAETARNVHLHKPAWLDGYLADYAENQARLAAAAAAVNEGVARLNKPLVNVFESKAERVSPPQTYDAASPDHVAALLIGMLAATRPDSSSQMATVSLLRDYGLTLRVESIEELSQQARLRKRVESLIAVLRMQPVRQGWQQANGSIFDEPDVIAMLATNPANADWLAARPEAQARKIEAGEARNLAAVVLRRQQADRLWERLGGDAGANGAGSSAVVWLLVVSMTVCIVGVTNAMLVSVLERFREIATMKCLGALDTFIATLFLMEAGLLGIVGGLLGVVLGGIVGVARMVSAFGSWTWSYFPTAELVAITFGAVGVGWLLTTLAAIYPAIKAASMPPMEAMRVE